MPKTKLSLLTQIFAPCLIMAWVYGCSDSEDFPCIAGTMDCKCVEGGCADHGAVCIDGTCSKVSCQVGEQGCACHDDYTCSQQDDRQWLRCEAGLCGPAPCPEGELGCPCVGAGLCSTGLSCSDESGVYRCEDPDCPPGALDCSCFVDRTCGVDELGRRLVCDGSVCAQRTCEPGSVGCVCGANFGCDSGLLCGDDNRCNPVTCVPGSIGCHCLTGGGCITPTLECVNGSCQEPGCPAGTAGCGCLADAACTGGSLVCTNGRCTTPVCAVGSLGCACFNDGTCELGGTCAEGWCMAINCLPGRANCPCADGDCDAGTVCLADTICVDDTGHPGGQCLPNRTCLPGNRCELDQCVACLMGSVACNCDDVGGCAQGLACLAGRCVAEESLLRQPPTNPVCYTPCTADLYRGSEVIPCGDDRLMPGCLEGTSCVMGTCMAVISSTFDMVLDISPICSSDVDCPDHQACIQGHCYSECVNQNDCDAPLVCERHVCRLPCDIENAPCPGEQVCESDEGTSGYCYDVDDSSLGSATMVGSFALLDNSLDFSVVRDSGSVYLHNSGREIATLRVRKSFHSEFHEDPTDDRRLSSTIGPDDCIDVGECPVEWLEMGWKSSQVTMAPLPVQLLEVSVPGGCQADPVRCKTDNDCGSGLSGNVCNTDGFCACDINSPNFQPACQDATDCIARIDFQQAAGFSDDTIRSWRGEVSVELPGVAEDAIRLTYRAGSEGSWIGNIHYYANFETTGLHDWLAGGRRDSDLNQVQNALITQWGAFRRGDLDWDQFKAVLVATESESWRFPNVEARCDDAACYLHDRGEGIGVYSSSLRTQPIPTGSIQLPFAMNITPDTEGLMADPPVFAGLGKILTGATLHYPGDPALHLEFETDPGQCAPGFLDCVAFLGDFAADVYIGGRYLSKGTDVGCYGRPDGTYDRLGFPWLPDGFAPPGYHGSLDAAPDTLYECRDKLIPVDPASGNAAEIEDANMRAAAANPVPDAQTRKRSIALIDGVLVNEGEMFILFEESFESGGRQFNGYGYMRLGRIPTTLDKSDGDGDGIADPFDGNAPPPERQDPPGILGAACDYGLLNEALDFVNDDPSVTTRCTPDNVGDCIDQLSELLMFGRSSQPTQPLNPVTEQVHYLCVDSGLFDKGPSAFAPTGAPPNDNTCTCRGGACNDCQDDFATDFDPYAANHERYPVNNQCEYIADDGVCDDGGPGALSAMCAFGTDKDDCGERTVADLEVECPPDSEVIFFTVDPAVVPQADIDAHPCQIFEGTSVAFGGDAQGACGQVLQGWLNDGTVVQADPFWRCSDPTRTFCDGNRGDLRAGKLFFQAGSTEPTYTRLSTQIANAFRYKTQFLGRSGSGVGFVPEVCSPTPELRPYCYDAGLIQSARQRVDCLTYLYANHFDDYSVIGPTREKVGNFLVDTFSFAQDENDRAATAREGFERLNAELQIMLGDEAFMRAFASRFDLAGVHIASFDGVAFEGPTGINLSGVAGYEMNKLYEAVQYYDMVLARFFNSLPGMWEALSYQNTPEPMRNFVSQGTVTTYLDRVVRASTQKARVYGEIAKRYQNFNMAPLARNVIERAYSASYLESQVLAQLLLEITNTLAPSDKPQVRFTMEQTQRAYHIALLNMREVYGSLTSELNYFGFAPDYVPFPALDDPGGNSAPPNAFDAIQPVVQSKVEFSAQREDEALISGRQFDVDTEQFQAELARIRNSYDNGLADICGTFEVEDSSGATQLFPAIPAYAHLHPFFANFGDPCGLVEGSGLRRSYGEVDIKNTELARVLQAEENVLAKIDQQMSFMALECDSAVASADMVWESQGVVNSLQAGIRTTELIMDTAKEVFEAFAAIAELTVCEPPGAVSAGDCPVAAGIVPVVGIGAGVTAGIMTAGRIVNLGLESQIDSIDRRSAYLEGVGDCEVAQIKYRDVIFDLTMEMELLKIDIQKATYQVQLAVDQATQLRNQATRLMSQREEAIDMAVNIAAAKNDPNVRIYRNDAYFNADLAFFDALRGLYKLTKIYEYYTSQSYARLEELYLARMVKRGDINLENYLLRLTNDFASFEETYGNPDVRITALSLRDDIFRISPLDGESMARGRREMLAEFRDELRDVSRLDTNGYTVIPFTTLLEKLSPLTRNHKVLYVEAELQGDKRELGDDLARIYIKQRGTGVVRGLDDEKAFYAFPPRTAVIDTFINGNKPFDSRVYRNYRLRDRPLVNTQWELVFNQVDESENDDINIDGLTDIVLYVYYTDFTAL